MDDARPAARARVWKTLAIALCWVPPVTAVVLTVNWRQLLAIDLPTRWSGDAVTSTMPGWIVALCAIAISIVCSALATWAINSTDAMPATLIFTAGLSAVAAAVWIFLGSESMFGGADGGITPLAAISPLLVLWGLLPWALSRDGAHQRSQEV